MKPIAFCIAFLLCHRLQSQTIVFDKKTYTWAEAVRLTDSVGNGYHLPNPKQQDSIFTATYDKRLMASSITSHTCYTSDSTIVGRMRGRQYAAELLGYDFQGNPLQYSFFLIR